VPKKTELAWAAAILEGEGSVFLRQSGGSKSWTPIVCITNTELAMVHRWHEAVGYRGSVTGPRRKKGSLGNKPTYRVTASFRKAEEILELLLPYMTPNTKKYAAAQAGLELMAGRPRQARHIR